MKRHTSIPRFVTHLCQVVGFVPGRPKHSTFLLSTAVCACQRSDPAWDLSSNSLRPAGCRRNRKSRPRLVRTLKCAAPLKSRSGLDRHSGSTRHGLPHLCACAPRTDNPGAARGRYRSHAQVLKVEGAPARRFPSSGPCRVRKDLECYTNAPPCCTGYGRYDH